MPPAPVEYRNGIATMRSAPILPSSRPLVGRNGVEQLLDVVADADDKRLPEIARACVLALGAQTAGANLVAKRGTRRCGDVELALVATDFATLGVGQHSPIRAR